MNRQTPLISDTTDGQHSVFDVEHIQTGEHRRIAALTEVQEWMLAACRNAQPAPSDLQETAEASSTFDHSTVTKGIRT